MSEPESFAGMMSDAMRAMGPMVGQLADLSDMHESSQRWEYKLCLWDEVAAAAADGWRMVPSGPHPISTSWVSPAGEETRGTQPGYVMERKRGPESEAEAILRGVRDGSIPVIEFPNEAGTEVSGG